jgi:hypothetical protein
MGWLIRIVIPCAFYLTFSGEGARLIEYARDRPAVIRGVARVIAIAVGTPDTYRPTYFFPQ